MEEQVQSASHLSHVQLRRDSGTRRLRTCLPLAASALAATLLLAPVADAQEAAAEDSFTVQRFNPAPGPRNYFTTRGIRQDGQMAWSGAFMANWGYKPFVVVSCESATDCDSPNATDEENVLVVENLATADFMGSFTPFPQLQVGLRVPVTFVKGQGITDTGEAADIEGDGLQAVGLGDVELEGKFRLVGQADEMFAIGAAVFVTAPTGEVTSEGNYIGDASVTAGGRGIFDFDMGPFSAAANLVGIYRGSGRIGATELGPEFRYGVAGGYQVSPLLKIMLDGFGGTKFSSKNGTNTLELDGGVRINPVGTPFHITVGGGAGLIQGIGVPVGRAFLGFMFVQEGVDRDGDGLQDDVDECPTVPEDLDGYEDADGCPDADNDDDSILDDVDKCPDSPEDPDEFEDTDGCPEPDNDKDGVNDDRDQCPNEAETKNGFKDDDGCPDEADKDGDGVPDKTDKCPDAAEDTDGFEDTDGCPDPDNDQDGIPDDKDECYLEPETMNGIDDEDGCPDGEGAAPAPAPAPAPPAGGDAPAEGGVINLD